MALTNQFDKAVLTGAKPTYRLGFQVSMKASGVPNPAWIDLNAPDLKVTIGTDLHQTNSLVIAGKFPSISWKPQKKTGRFTISTNEITVDNTLKIFTVDPSTLRFTKAGTFGAFTIAAWRNRKVKIVLYERATDPTTWTEQVLGQFKIKGVTHHAASRTARIQFVGREQDFIETDGTDLRIGDAWPTDVPVPALLERIVEVVSGGEFSVSSDNPDYFDQDTDGTKYISSLGKVPRVNANGSWNQSNTFVVRYMFISDENATVYFCGYNTRLNIPALASWNRGSNTWVYKDFAVHSTWKGREAVFGVHSDTHNSDFIYVCVIANVVGLANSPNTEGHNPRNHVLHIAKIDADTLVFTRHVFARPAWMMHQMPQRAFQTVDSPVFKAYAWWYLPGQGGDGPNLQVPFDCQPHYANLIRPSFTEREGAYPKGTFSSTDDVEEGTDVRSIMITSDIKEDDFDDIGSGSQGDMLSGISPKGAVGLATLIHADEHETYHHPYACTYATGAAHDSFRWDGVHRHKIYWLQFYHSGGTTYEWRLWHYSIEDEDGAGAGYGFQTINFGAGYNVEQAFYDYNITAFDLKVNDPATSYLWIAYENLDGAVDGEVASTHLVRFTFGTGNLSSPTAFTFDSAEQDVSVTRKNSPRFVSIRHNEDYVTGAPLFGCVLNRYAPAGPCYGLWFYRSASDRGLWKGHDSAHLPTSGMPFEISDDVSGNSSATDCYVQDQSTGVLWLIHQQRLGTGFSARILSNADPVDRENTWASCNVLGDVTNGRAYGVAASGPPADTQVPTFTKDYWDNHNEDFARAPELGLFTPKGRLIFWSYYDTIHDTIDVFDVGDGSAWDACEMLREIGGDFVMYLNTSLELVIRERGLNVGAAVGTIVQAGQYPTNTTFNDPVIPAESVESFIDYNSIVNHVTVKAFSPERSPVDVQLIIGPSSGANGAVVVAHQSNNRAQRITLKCAASGLVQADLPYNPSGTVLLKEYDGKIPALLFSWIKEQDDVTTTLKLPADINTTLIFVHGMFVEANGDGKIGDVVIRAGDTVLVSGGDSGTIHEDWDATVGYIQLDGPVGGNAQHKIGSTVTISPAIERRYSNSSRGVCTLTEAVTTGDTGEKIIMVDTTENLAEGMVLEYKGYYCNVLSIIDGTSLHIRPHALGSNRGGTSPGSPIPVGGVMNGFLWIRRSGRAYRVPGTGVSFSISQRAANQSSTGRFAVGDRIILTCEGYGVRELKHWIIRSTDAASIEDYGKMKWKPAVKNRLMTPTRARNLLTNLADLASPRYATTAKGMPLLVSTTVGDAWNVKSEHALGVTTAVLHEVTGITWHLSNSTMDLQLRSIDVVRRAGEGDIEGQAPAAGGGYRGDRPRERRRT